MKIVGVSMEKVTINHVYGDFLKREARERNIRLNFIDIPRSGNFQEKNRRIRSLTTRFQAGHIKIVETMRRSFIDAGEEKVLWDPHGFRSGQAAARRRVGHGVRALSLLGRRPDPRRHLRCAGRPASDRSARPALRVAVAQAVGQRRSLRDSALSGRGQPHP